MWQNRNGSAHTHVCERERDWDFWLLRAILGKATVYVWLHSTVCCYCFIQIKDSCVPMKSPSTSQASPAHPLSSNSKNNTGITFGKQLITLLFYSSWCLNGTSWAMWNGAHEATHAPVSLRACEDSGHDSTQSKQTELEERQHRCR